MAEDDLPHLETEGEFRPGAEAVRVSRIIAATEDVWAGKRVVDAPDMQYELAVDMPHVCVRSSPQFQRKHSMGRPVALRGLAMTS